MKIQYASDLHLEFADNWRYLRDNPLQVSGDILILAGDIGYLGDQNYQNHPFWDWESENYQQVLVVPGNHEFYKYYDLSKMEDGTEGEIRKNIHYYYNKVIRIGDVDFILSTLWAIISKEYAPYVEYGISDFHRIMYGNRALTYLDFNLEHDNCFYFIKKSVEESTAKHKIVVTHHVPSFQLCALEFEGSELNGAFTVESITSPENVYHLDAAAENSSLKNFFNLDSDDSAFITFHGCSLHLSRAASTKA